MTAILSQQLGLNSSLKVSVQIWIKIFCCYINVHVKMILSDFLFDMLLKWQSIFRLQFFESLPNWKENSVEPFGMTFCWFDNFDWFLVSDFPFCYEVNLVGYQIMPCRTIGRGMECMGRNHLHLLGQPIRRGGQEYLLLGSHQLKYRNHMLHEQYQNVIY